MFKKEILAFLTVTLLALPAFAADEPAKDAAPAAPTAETTAPVAATPAAPAEEVKKEESSVEGRMLLTQKLPHDVVFGKEDAPVTMVEYASLSCSHCRDFYMNVFEELKKNYIDTGKVKFVYRHYPLNINALIGAMELECGVSDPEKKKLFVGAMFHSQPEWAYKEDRKDVVAKLKSIARLGGIDDAKFDECAKEKSPLEDAILRQQIQTQHALGVSSTPTLYINNKQFFDKKEYATVAQAIDDAINNPGKEDAAPADAKPAEEKKEEKK